MIPDLMRRSAAVLEMKIFEKFEENRSERMLVE